MTSRRTTRQGNFVSIDEAAEQLNIDQNTVIEMVHSVPIEHLFRKNEMLINWDAILEYVNEFHSAGMRGSHETPGSLP